MKEHQRVSRRAFVAAGATGLAAVMTGARAEAAAWTTAEQANVQIVNDFCAAWAGHELEKIMSFFADSGAYRMTETMEPAKGREAVAARVKSILDRVGRFEIIETFAKGPMVFNERVDHFTSGQMRWWHGVGVFFLKDGKIVEWYDYTIAIERIQPV